MAGQKTLDDGSAVRADRRSSVYELFILSLTVLSLVVAVTLLLTPASARLKDTLVRIDLLFCVVFMVDSFRSLVIATDKRAFLKWGWLDFLGSIPAYPVLRFARVPRGVLAARRLRRRGTSAVTHEFRTRRPVSTFLVTFFIAMVVLSLASIFILKVENQYADANIDSGRDAFWWAFVTVTTVGYGDRVPVSWPGRLIAMTLMVVGVSIFGVLTSSLASWFVATEEGGRSDNIAAIRYDVDAMKDELAGIKSDVAEIKQLLQERSH